MGKNILVISSGMQPYENANGICTKPLIKELVKQNNKVYYLDSMAKGINKYITKNNIIIYGEEENLSHKENSVKTNKKSKNNIIKKLFFKIYSREIYPFNSIRRTKYLCNAAINICKNNKIDIIIAVYQPFISLYAGYYASKKNETITFIPYYLDLISNPYIPLPLNSVKRQKRIMNKWENKINKYATNSIYMLASRDYHENNNINKEWYDKIKYFDIPLFIPKNEIENKKDRGLNNINLLFCGYIGDHRNIEYFLKLVEKLPESITLTLAGNITVKQKNILNKYIENNKQKIKYIDYVPYEETHLLIEKADCLVNFGVQSKTAISAKIYEYMSYRKPIIMTYSIEDEPSMKVLEKYPLSFFLDERKNIDEKIINKTIDFLTNSINKKIDIKELNEIFYLNKPETFANYISSIKKI